MRNEINRSVIIDRPPADVFTSLIELSNWPRWGGGNLVSIEQISAGPMQVGSQLRQINRAGRKLNETAVQVTQMVPDESFGIAGPNLQGAFTLEPVETGTLVKARFQVEATGIAALMYRLLLPQFVASDLRRFKALVEAS